MENTWHSIWNTVSAWWMLDNCSHDHHCMQLWRKCTAQLWSLQVKPQKRRIPSIVKDRKSLIDILKYMYVECIITITYLSMCLCNPSKRWSLPKHRVFDLLSPFCSCRDIISRARMSRPANSAISGQQDHIQMIPRARFCKATVNLWPQMRRKYRTETFKRGACKVFCNFSSHTPPPKFVTLNIRCLDWDYPESNTVLLL